jgi:hypothetical protein
MMVMTDGIPTVLREAADQIESLQKAAHNGSGVPGANSTAHPGWPDKCRYGACPAARAMVAILRARAVVEERKAKR